MGGVKRVLKSKYTREGDLQTFYRVLEQLLNNFEEMSEHYDTVFESLRRES